MDLLIGVFVPLVLVCSSGHFQDGPTAKAVHSHSASVSGRVTIGNAPAVGVQVALRRSDNSPGVENNIYRAKTDQDGHYLLDSLTSGYYTVQVVEPTMVVQGEESQGRKVSLREGMKLENIDFALVPGGVITGRVTDGEGSPIRDLLPTLKVVNEKGQSTFFEPGTQESETDDRGIFRIYGLPPGRYIVGFGPDWGGPSDGLYRSLLPRKPFPLTYYPGFLDEPQAKKIEVTAGSEITGIDISLTVKKNLFKATGTVVDVDRGAPLGGAVLRYGTLWGKNDTGEGPHEYESVRSDSDGRFKLDRLESGRHFLRLANDYSHANNSFGDQVTFEVTDGDVDGLEVKVHHGSAINGIVVSASPDDGQIAAELVPREVYAVQLKTNPINGSLKTDYVAQATVGSDRSFRLAGLPPGKYQFQMSNDGQISPYIKYIDWPTSGRLMNRVPYPPGFFEGDPIEIGEGQNTKDIQGVRIALDMPRGVIRGQLRFAGGPLPQNAYTDVSIVMLPASDTRPWAGAAVDPDGRFVVRSLPAGQYMINVAVYIPNKSDSGTKILAKTSETVSLSDGEETTVTLTLNLSGKQPGTPD